MPVRPYSAFNRGIYLTVKMLRERRGLTQQDAASAFQVTLDAYKKWETRSPIPHYYLPILCRFYDIEIAEFYSMAAKSAAGSRR